MKNGITLKRCDSLRKRLRAGDDGLAAVTTRLARAFEEYWPAEFGFELKSGFPSTQSAGTWLSQSENCDPSRSLPSEGGGGAQGLLV